MDRERVVLFGAGASFGAEVDSRHAPPLGGDLYARLRKQYPLAWGALTAEQGQDFAPSFERGMERLWDEGGHDTATLLSCVADYFAQFRPSATSRYEALMVALQSRNAVQGTTFSSLNYECVFEYVASARGFTIDYFPQAQTADASLALLKLHGSCNFMPKGISGLRGALSFNVKNIVLDGGIDVIQPHEVGQRVNQNVFVPAMAVFMDGKPLPSGRSTIIDLQRKWADAVAGAQIVGIVGVRVNEGDAHVWEPLASTRARLVVIGDDAYREWAARRRDGKDTVIVGDRFATALDDFVEQFSK